MNKMLAVLLVSASLVSCGGKKESTTPVNKDSASMEHKDDATGGAAYGGKTAGGAASEAAKDAAKDAANPCAPK